MKQKLIDIIHDHRFKTVQERAKISLLILAAYIILSLLHIGCPIRFTTGISCPGCGMTRAVLSALRFDFHSAFYDHPLFIITPFMFYLFLFEDYINPRLYKAFWAVIIILFLIVYLVRLFILQNNIVSVDIQNSIFLKLIHHISVKSF